VPARAFAGGQGSARRRVYERLWAGPRPSLIPHNPIKRGIVDIDTRRRANANGRSGLCPPIGNISSGRHGEGNGALAYDVHTIAATRWALGPVFNDSGPTVNDPITPGEDAGNGFLLRKADRGLERLDTGHGGGAEPAAHRGAETNRDSSRAFWDESGSKTARYATEAQVSVKEASADKARSDAYLRHRQSRDKGSRGQQAQWSASTTAPSLLPAGTRFRIGVIYQSVIRRGIRRPGIVFAATRDLISVSEQNPNEGRGRNKKPSTHISKKTHYTKTN